ncbi:MAG: FadR family transcriptional regulator [Desulfobacterales bacterium]|nr:MAG: FadR family transcriptional regulator [Desulfobacterales bacterium]
MKQSLPFKQIKKTRLYEEIAEQIKDAILDGHLKPNDRLPSERDLCEMFGVGRPTVREALRVLDNMGLIEIGPGIKGSTVKDVDITQYMDAVREHLSHLIKVNEETIRDLWEVRKYIELGISLTAAHKARQTDIKKLRECIQRMEACGNDTRAYFPIAVEFHKYLAEATQNKIFYILWGMFQDILLKGYMPNLESLFPGGPARLLESNKTLLKAIESGDPDQIKHAMEVHTEEERFFDSKD